MAFSARDLVGTQRAIRLPALAKGQRFSRTLNHHRRIYSTEVSNLFVSETGPRPGEVAVVEVMLVNEDDPPEGLSRYDRARFALYDPDLDAKIDRYPDNVRFEIAGFERGSQSMPAPEICVQCHDPFKPLTALMLHSELLEKQLAAIRNAGVGIRQAGVELVPITGTSEGDVLRLNSQMRKRFPYYYRDLRTEMIRHSPSHVRRPNTGDR